MTDTIPMKVVEADSRFDRRFAGHLMQVFLYVTDECNIRCTQCYYSPWLKKGHAEMPTSVALALLRKFRELGAMKVTLLGGEPTLYGQAPGNEPLSYLVHAAHQMGFEYVRMVTNGLFKESILVDERLREIDEITFSMDGDTAEIHDALRGRKTFERSLKNLQAAVREGYTVNMTMCVHRGNIGRTTDGTLYLSRAIKWAAALGVKSFNIHPLFRMGVPRDAWTGDTDIQPLEWLTAYREIQESIKRSEYGIRVRVPLRFATNAEFDKKPRFHGYCSVKHADRLDVHPNGQIHTCALHNGTPISVAIFEDTSNQVRIRWALQNNELEQHPFKDGEEHPCAVMNAFPNGLRPLCISLKPGQDEFIWNRMHIE